MTGRTASTHDDGAATTAEVGPAGTAKGNGSNSNRHPGALQSTQVKTASTKGREATKENVKPAEGDGARRRRKLPSPGGPGGFGGGGKMRRAQSLSFLPSVGDPNNGERTRCVSCCRCTGNGSSPGGGTGGGTRGHAVLGAYGHAILEGRSQGSPPPHKEQFVALAPDPHAFVIGAVESIRRRLPDPGQGRLIQEVRSPP